jgi:transcriptional regulator with XRE-family HTH domain
LYKEANLGVMNTDFGDRLRVVLSELFSTQEEAARFFGVSQASISRWFSTDRFSKKVLMNLKRLEDRGVDVRYFDNPAVTDWRKKEEKKKEIDPEVYDLQKQVIELERENRELEKKLWQLIHGSNEGDPA